MPDQLPLELAHRPSLARDDFLIGPSNAEALAMVDSWPNWPTAVVVLAGPPGSGKTHIADVWRAATGAPAVTARGCGSAEPDLLLTSGTVVVEDLHDGPVDEAALFHLLNRVGERRGQAIVTSRVWPKAAGLRLPDLVSRLTAARLVEIGEPDDELLRRVLVKLFADRQLQVAPATIEFLLRRMERSLGAARTLSERLDRRALAEGRAVTRALAADVLAEGVS